eukprot:6477410-Amphidinium_carterae.3
MQDGQTEAHNKWLRKIACPPLDEDQAICIMWLSKHLFFLQMDTHRARLLCKLIGTVAASRFDPKSLGMISESMWMSSKKGRPWWRAQSEQV